MLKHVALEITEEIDNIRAGLYRAVEHGNEREIERYTKGLFRFYDIRGWYQEGKRTFAWVAGRVTDPRLLASLLARQGYFCCRLSEYKQARRLHRKSLAILQRIGAPEDTSLSLYNLGNIAYQQGNYEQAKRLYRRSIRIYRQVGSHFGLALCLNDLGVICLLQGDYAQANQLFRKSLAIRTKIGDQSGVAKSLTNLGLIADRLGQRKKTRRFFERSLEISREGGDQRGIATALTNLGVLMRRIGEKQQSPALLEEARGFVLDGMAVYREIGARGGVVLCLHNLAGICGLLDEVEQSEMHSLEAMRSAVEIRATPLLLSIFTGLARLLIQTRQPVRAFELLRQVAIHTATVDEDREQAERLICELRPQLPPALRSRDGSNTLSEEAADPYAVAEQWLTGAVRIRAEDAPPVPASAAARAEIDIDAKIAEGRAAERQARPAAARECYETALYSLRSSAQGATAASLTRWIGRTYITEGDFGAAEDCLHASLAIATTCGDLSGVAHATNLQGIASYQRGQLDDAVRIYKQAQALASRAHDAQLVAMIDQNLGVVANIQGDLQMALKHYRASLAGFRSLRMEEDAVGALNNLGMIYTDLQCWQEAEQALDEAVATCKRIGKMNVGIMAMVNQVELWIAQSMYDQARSACDAAFELASELGDLRALGELHKHYGVMFRETEHFHLAETHLERAAAIAHEREDLLLAAETAREQAELFWRQQRNQQTLQSLNSAHRWFSQLRARRDLAEVNQRNEELENLFLEIVGRWGESIESADGYTQGHCERVANVACTLAEAIGLDEKTLLWFRMGALLHDVGKIVVPLEILNKPGPLDPEERAIMERHADAGVELLAGIEFPWDIRPMVRHHHERWQGGGYPTGIAGEEIPLSGAHPLHRRRGTMHSRPIARTGPAFRTKKPWKS